MQTFDSFFGGWVGVGEGFGFEVRLSP